MALPRPVIVASLGTAQTLAWASSYYIPAVLAVPIARDLGLSTSTVFGIFSGSLLLSAFLGPYAGRVIDRNGGRDVLAISNLVFAAGLALLGASSGIAGLVAAWTLLGVAMSIGLYDSAFATLAGLYGKDARGPITGITLIAGFASTVGWPASSFMAEAIGWQGACFVWAAVHIALGLPLNRFLIPKTPPPASALVIEPSEPAPPGTMVLLAFVFAATWFVTSAMAAHLPLLMEATGASAAAAIFAGTLIGPAQVAARLLEFSLMRRFHPLVSARWAAAAHPIGAVLLVVFGPIAAPIFALVHGAGNGLLTIAKGTLPLAIFGPIGYGYRSGVLSVPARGTQAAAPFLFGLIIEHGGAGAALAVSAGLSLSALIALMLLRPHTQGASQPIAER
jgi:predicted MFS family arabinose efflux permease